MSDCESEPPYDEDSASMDVDVPELKEEGDICGDGSIIKTIVRAGTGPKAMHGAKCSVHYVGTLTDGTKFDSSRDRSDPFEFTIGSGVIKGWSEGVATMKTGELANFTIQAHKAYGASGSPPTIPPNAPLNFEIELLSWTNATDVSSKRDKSVMKSIVKKGDGYVSPKSLSAATVQFSVELEDGTVTKAADADATTIIVDDGDISDGFDDLVKSMKSGEVATYEIASKKAFGASGNAAFGVPPNANIKGTITLVSFTNPKSHYDLSAQEKFARLEELKSEGNTLFKASSFAKAMRRYKAALEVFSYTSSLEGEEKAKAESANVACNLNVAACQLKLKLYKEAVDTCDKVLKEDAVNAKALFRRASANLERGEWDLAQADFHKLSTSDPSNKDAADGLKKVQALKAAQKEKDKALYSKMFK